MLNGGVILKKIAFLNIFGAKITFFEKTSCLCLLFEWVMCYALTMKNFLTHFPYNMKLGIMLFCSIGMIPNDLAMVLQTDLPHEIVQNDNTNSPESENNITNSDEPSKEGEDPKPNPTPGDDDEDEDPEKELYDFGSDLIIRAFNPGYREPLNSDDKLISNVGEFIELLNLTDTELALAGYSLRYTSGGSGKTTTIFTFPEGSYLTSKHLLLRYYKAPEHEQADLNYETSLALDTGPLELLYYDEVVDTVCWDGTTKCQSKFQSTKKSTLVRDLYRGTFRPSYYLNAADPEKYEPEFSATEIRLIWPEEPAEDDPPAETPAPKCRGLEITEILSYYEEDKSEQYIELFNPTASQIELEGCRIGFKNKTYPLKGIIKSGEYLAYAQSSQFALTKNPKNPLTITLIDADGEPIDEMAYPNGQKKSTSYSKIFDAQGNETWEITYAITPGAENIYQKFRNCEEGKIINEATGNCVKVTSLKSSVSSTLKSATTTVAPCPAGKYRNPLTGRCKNIESTTATLKECAEGYERNPETNRCRKIAKTNDGAEFALEPVTRSDETVFIGIGIVALIIILGLIYVILQFRQEILRAGRKVGQCLNHVCQNLFARKIGRHRNKKP